MELSLRRRRSSLARQATRVNIESSGMKRQTRSAAKMDVANVEITKNSSLVHLDRNHHHQQQQQQQQQQQLQQHFSVDANVTAEDTTKVAETSVDQSPISATEQSRSSGTVAATTSDSTVDNVEKVDDGDDNDYFIDVSPADDNITETETQTDDTSDDSEAAKMLEPAEVPKSSEDAADEMSLVVMEKATEVKDDGMEDRNTSTQASSECDQLAVTSEGVTDVDTELSGTEKRVPTDADMNTDIVETSDNTLHYQQQQLGHDTLLPTENATEVEMTLETENSTEEEKQDAQNDEENDKDEEDDGHEECEDGSIRTANERNSDEGEEEDLETEMSPGPQYQPEAVEDFTRLQKESIESGDGDFTNAGVPDSENGVGISTPVKTEHIFDDEQASMSSSLSNPARPLPATSALLFPGDGPPVPVIRVTCGDCRAEFHVDRLVDGLGAVSNSIGTSRTSLCVRTVDDDDENRDGGTWMTPNQFQRASGRGTARDWKRSIKHHGVSLKSLLSKAVLSFDATSPGCRCNLCTVSVVAMEISSSSSSSFFILNHPFGILLDVNFNGGCGL